MLFMSYSLDGVQIPVYESALDVRFGKLGTDDIEDYLRFRRGSDRREIEQRFAKGDRCFVSWHRDSIVDACWTATGSHFIPYLNRWLEIPEGDIYSYDSFTSPEHRGRGIYMARNSFTARENQAEGFKRSIALVAFENYAAWLILTRSGLSTLGAYHFVRTPAGGVYWRTVERGETLPRIVAPRAPGRSSAVVAASAI